MSGSDPMGGLTCDEVRELSGSFVLGALEPEDDAAVRAHLTDCPEAHGEMAELGGVLPALAESVPAVEPPEGLKARILAAAAADLAARPPRAPVGVVAAPAGTSTAPTTSAGQTRVSAPTIVSAPTASPQPTSLSDARRRLDRRSSASATTWLMRIAAVVALVALGGWNLLLQGDLSASRSYEQSVASVLSVAGRPGSLTAILRADGGTGSGLAAVSASGQVAMAMQDLAPTTGETVYEAWAIGGDGVPVPIGSFKVGKTGTAYFEATGVPSANGTVLALTHEPAAGAKTPTAPVISKGVAAPAG